MPERPTVVESRGIEFVGYHDLQERPAFKLGLQCVGDRWYLYCGHLWHSGWSIVDVTDPANPELLRFVTGPADSWTLQVQVADGLMITALEGIPEEWGGTPGGAHDEGALIWDVATDPENPVLLGQYRVNGRGTHRNFYAGGDLAVMTASSPAGFQGKLPVFVDVSDPSAPREISRWWWPGQHVAGGETPEDERYFHGPAYIRGDRAFLGYGPIGMIVLDISDVTKPELVQRLDFGDFGSRSGCHSAVPVPGRNLIVVNDEAIFEGTDEPLNYAVIVEEKDDTYRIISSLPVPRPEPGLPYRSYYQRGGRFGPHNQHHHQDHPDLLADPDRVYMTYFVGGLRVFDISDPYMPEEIAHFVPSDPVRRYGVKPATLVTQFEDVLVDRRGVIYCTDKNWGLFVLRLENGI